MVKNNKKRAVVAMSPHKSLRDYAGQAGGTRSKLRVVVAMSGGVDSSVAAFLLQKKGYEVIGIFLRLTSGAEAGEAAARRVCRRLGVRFYPVNLKAKFRKEVVDYFLDSYALGLTPNPCVKCNRFIKFGELLKIARGLGAEKVATGHYARLRREFPISNFQFPNKFKIQSASWRTKSKIEIFKLLRGVDKKKDQSYFLYNLNQKILKQALFPLGGYKKAEVRKIADKAGLPYLKSESQDICFFSGDHNEFLKRNLKLKKGPIMTSPRPRFARPPLSFGRRGAGGEVVGEHQGLPLYTRGQRRGVEIGGTGPYWVVKCDYKNNILYVTNKKDDPALFGNELTARDVNWVSGIQPKMPLKCLAVIRYGHEGVECEVKRLKSSEAQPPNWRLSLGYIAKMKKPQRAATSGQSVALYSGDEVLGGGVIK